MWLYAAAGLSTVPAAETCLAPAARAGPGYDILKAAALPPGAPIPLAGKAIEQWT